MWGLVELSFCPFFNEVKWTRFTPYPNLCWLKSTLLWGNDKKGKGLLGFIKYPSLCWVTWAGPSYRWGNWGPTKAVLSLSRDVRSKVWMQAFLLPHSHLHSTWHSLSVTQAGSSSVRYSFWPWPCQIAVSVLSLEVREGHSSFLIWEASPNCFGISS